MVWNRLVSTRCMLLSLCLFVGLLSGCAAMPGSGASRMQVLQAERSKNLEGITLVDVDDTLARKLAEGKKVPSFSEMFRSYTLPSYRVGAGDVLEVSVWESPPNMLFGGIALDSKTGAVSTRPETLPPQMIMDDGKITVPFVGRVSVTGLSVREIEASIVEKLQGKANHPQVVVRVTENPTSFVTVIGDVTNSSCIRLTPRGERLLDALAQAGGVTQPVSGVSMQISRSSVTASMPLDTIIRDPKQNIHLLPGDVVTALFQPLSFTVLGATSKNQEVPFEAKGISLAQALARAGGLNDSRADPGGVFIFRFENPTLVDTTEGATPVLNGTVPVIYQVNFNDPSAFFAIQNFPMQDKDMLYVANMPSAELEKFLRMIGMVLTPTLNITRTAQTFTQ